MLINLPQKDIADFCQRNHVQKLAIFGSALGPRLRPDSDIDVLVLFKPDVQIGFLALGRMRRELEAILGRPVDLVPQAGLKPLIRDQILDMAESVYAA